MCCFVTVTFKVGCASRSVLNIPMIVKEHIIDIINNASTGKELGCDVSHANGFVECRRHILTIVKLGHRVITEPGVQHQMRNRRGNRSFRSSNRNGWCKCIRSGCRCRSCRRTRRCWAISELCNFNTIFLFNSVATIETRRTHSITTVRWIRTSKAIRQITVQNTSPSIHTTRPTTSTPSWVCPTVVECIVVDRR
jgi:hypothetical protein